MSGPALGQAPDKSKVELVRDKWHVPHVFADTDAGAMYGLGYCQGLDGFGSLETTLDVTAPPLSCTDGQTIKSQASQSYTQFVPMHDVDAAMSILPIGASDRPGDKHRTSTLKMWGEGRLRPAPLSRKAVDKIAESSMVVGGK